MSATESVKGDVCECGHAKRYHWGYAEKSRCRNAEHFPFEKCECPDYRPKVKS